MKQSHFFPNSPLPGLFFQKPKFQLYFLLILSVFFLMSACTQQKPNTPITVAQAFWNAALAGDTETAKQFLSPQSRPNFKIILYNPKDFVEFGEQNVNSTETQILTQLVHHKDGQQSKTALRTILINQNGQWLVDFDRTRDSMLGNELQAVIEQLSETMRETIDKGVKIMGESVKDELQQMERALQDTIQNLNQELELQQQQKINSKAPKTI